MAIRHRSVGQFQAVVAEKSQRTREQIMFNLQSCQRGLLAATAFAFLAAATVPGATQAPPGFSPMDKSNPAASKQDNNLKPHPVPPTVTPVEKLPLDKIKLPPGFRVEVYSSGHPGGRTMVFGNKGTMFMGTRAIGRVYAVVEKDGKREAKVLLQGLTQPNGLA